MNVNEVVSEISGVDISGKTVVIKKKFFHEDFSEGDRRFLVESGFGCKPYLRGTAIFGKFLADGEEARLSRTDVEGLAKYGEGFSNQTGQTEDK